MTFSSAFRRDRSGAFAVSGLVLSLNLIERFVIKVVGGCGCLMVVLSVLFCLRGEFVRCIGVYFGGSVLAC